MLRPGQAGPESMRPQIPVPGDPQNCSRKVPEGGGQRQKVLEVTWLTFLLAHCDRIFRAFHTISVLLKRTCPEVLLAAVLVSKHRYVQLVGWEQFLPPAWTLRGG